MGKIEMTMGNREIGRFRYCPISRFPEFIFQGSALFPYFPSTVKTNSTFPGMPPY